MEVQGVDPSLVRRWLRNERTPKLNSGHYERIVAVLGLGARERQQLRDAQVESLEGPPVWLKGDVGEGVERILRSEQREGLRLPVGDAALPIARLPFPGQIRGRTNVLRCYIALLEAAPESPPPEDREILFTYQGEGTFDDYTDLLPSWLAALRATLQRGYGAVHLLRIDADARRSARLVEHMLTLLGTAGSYQPRYFARYGIISPSYDLFYVPGAGAIVGFATEQPTRTDAALFVSNPQQMDVLRGHFQALKAQTKPLLVSYACEGGALEFLEALVRVEQKEGDCFLSKNGLSLHTEPPSWFHRDHHRPRNVSAYPADPGLVRELQRRRLNAFYQQVESHGFREICPKSAVVRMVREGVASPHGFAEALTCQERLEQIENLIALLNSFDNFQLALASETEERDCLTSGFWEVKWSVEGEHSVLMEGSSLTEGRAEKRLGVEILEPTMCAAFRDYFLELFEHKLSPLSRDRREAKLFLEAQAAWLRDRIGE